MAIERKTCVNHPDRRAIGICVITGRAICAECSTRYEGVNYSKEGLRILRERRAAEAEKGARRRRLLAWAAAMATPLFVAAFYGGCYVFFRMLTNLIHY